MIDEDGLFLDRYISIGRLCLLGCSLLFLRYFLSSFIGRMEGYDIDIFKSKELLRGIHLCIFQDNKMNFVGWSVPLADATYFVMGTSLHLFLLFGPFCIFLDSKSLFCKGLLLFVTGPVLSYFLSNNSYEQASIWTVIATVQVSTTNVSTFATVLFWIYIYYDYSTMCAYVHTIFFVWIRNLCLFCSLASTHMPLLYLLCVCGYRFNY